jgi:hypothetical protein
MLGVFCDVGGPYGCVCHYDGFGFATVEAVGLAYFMRSMCRVKGAYYVVGHTQGADPPPPPPLLAIAIAIAMAGKNHLNEEITPLLPTGIGERYSQTISNLGHAGLLHRRCELPLETKTLNYSKINQGALRLIHYSEGPQGIQINLSAGVVMTHHLYADEYGV